MTLNDVTPGPHRASLRDATKRSILCREVALKSMESVRNGMCAKHR